MPRFRSFRSSVAPCTTPKNEAHMTMLSLSHQIETNTITRLNLMKALGTKSNESHDDVIESMKKNESVKDVYLGPYFYASLTDQGRSQFIRSLGQDLRHLRSLSIGTLEHTKACITGASIGYCIAQAKHHFHTIRVERDITLSSAEEAAVLAQGLWHHPTLRRVSLLNLKPTSPTASSLDSILYSLSSIPELESLQLGISADCAIHLATTPEAVASLAHSCPKLSWLYMARFPITDCHMFELFHAIGTQQECLKVLDFPQSHLLTIACWKALWELLQSNAVLESVNMSAPPWAKRAKTLTYSMLALNRDGKRQRLRDSKDLDTWIGIAHTLVQTGDPNILYTIVRENPSICSRSFRS